MPVVLAHATTGSHRARAQSAVSDGAGARNRPARLHGSLTILDPKDRVHLLIPQAVIPILLRPSCHKLESNPRVDRDRMIQSHHRAPGTSSTSQTQPFASEPRASSETRVLNHQRFELLGLTDDT